MQSSSAPVTKKQSQEIKSQESKSQEAKSQDTKITPLTLTSPFKDHAAAVFEMKYHIHGYDYGIAVIAATFIDPLICLYRNFDDEAWNLSEEEIISLTIIMLFNFNALNDDKLEENRSVLYQHLTKLGVSSEKAKRYVEAFVDANGEHGSEVQSTQSFFSWKKSDTSVEKSIYQKLIYDALHLAAINFSGNCYAKDMNFYKQFASKNKHALDVFAELIFDAKRLVIKLNAYHLYWHNDSFRQLESLGINVVHEVERVIRSRSQSLLCQLQQRSLSKEALKEIFTKRPVSGEMNQMMRQGKIFARSLSEPLIVAPQYNVQHHKITVENEASFHYEMQQMAKEDKSEQKANSIAPLGYGNSIYSMVGFLIINPELKEIRQIAGPPGQGDFYNYPPLFLSLQKRTPASDEVIEEKLHHFIEHIKLGGVHRREEMAESDHVNAIRYHITKFDAVYFSHDSIERLKEEKRAHPHSPVLQAIYLQQEYQKITKKDLPIRIVEYLALEDTVESRSYTNEQILKMWEELCDDFVRKQLPEGYYDVLNLTVDQLKDRSLNTWCSIDKCMGTEFKQADGNYPQEFKKQIDVSLLALRESISLEYQKRQLEAALSGTIFENNIARDLIHFPKVREDVRVNAKIKTELSARIKKLEQLDCKEYLSEFSGCKALIQNPAKFFEFPSNLKEYYSVEANVLYALAKAMKLADLMSAMQQLARNEIIAIIGQDPNVIRSYLKRCTVLIALFDLGEEDSMRLSNAIIQSLMRLATLDLSDDFVEEIQKVHKYGLLNDRVAQTLQPKLISYGRTLHDVEAKANLKEYLKLANITKIPLIEQKSCMSMYLQRQDVSLQRYNSRDLIDKMFESGAIDAEIFNLLLKKMDIRRDHEGSVRQAYFAFSETFEFFSHLPSLSSSEKEKTKVRLAEYYLDSVKNIASEERGIWELEFYVKLYAAAKIDRIVRKQAVIHFLEFHRFKPIEERSFQHNDTAILAWFTKHPEIFSLVIQKATSQDYEKFMTTVKLFNSIVPGKLFTPAQIFIIKKYAKEKFGRFDYLGHSVTSQVSSSFFVAEQKSSSPVIETKSSQQPKELEKETVSQEQADDEDDYYPLGMLPCLFL